MIGDSDLSYEIALIGTNDKSILFRRWLGAIRQQTISWVSANRDICRHMASLGHNELTHWGLSRNSQNFGDDISNVFSWKTFHFNLYTIVIYSLGSNWPEISIGFLFGDKPLREPMLTQWLTHVFPALKHVWFNGYTWHIQIHPMDSIPHEINTPLQWRHNDHDGVSNYQPHDCLLNRLFRRRSKKTVPRHWPWCGEFTGIGEFPAQREKCFHVMTSSCGLLCLVSLWLPYEFRRDFCDLFNHIRQGCFTGTGTIVRFFQCWWSKPTGYAWWHHQMETFSA